MIFKARNDLTTKWVRDKLMVHDSANGDVHILNETAAKVFQLCDGSLTVEEIAKKLAERFDGVDYSQAYEDVKKILNTLEAKNLAAQVENFNGKEVAL
jgi:hypothetical protein